MVLTVENQNQNKQISQPGWKAEEDVLIWNVSSEAGKFTLLTAENEKYFWKVYDQRVTRISN